MKFSPRGCVSRFALGWDRVAGGGGALVAETGGEGGNLLFSDLFRPVIFFCLDPSFSVSLD
jgi:hypothetical protein